MPNSAEVTKTIRQQHVTEQVASSWKASHRPTHGPRILTVPMLRHHSTTSCWCHLSTVRALGYSQHRSATVSWPTGHVTWLEFHRIREKSSQRSAFGHVPVSSNIHQNYWNLLPWSSCQLTEQMLACGRRICSCIHSSASQGILHSCLVNRSDHKTCTFNLTRTTLMSTSPLLGLGPLMEPPHRPVPFLFLPVASLFLFLLKFHIAKCSPYFAPKSPRSLYSETCSSGITAISPAKTWYPSACSCVPSNATHPRSRR